MKKLFLIIVIFFNLMMLVCCKNDEDYKRLRIIAENNTSESIDEKTLIKNTIKTLFENETLNYQDCNPEELDELLKKELPSDLYNKLTIDECISYYPAKAYQNKMIPSGDYKTILITIGSGGGHNFWTLLYPEYFGYEFEENNEIEYRSYFYDLFNKQK